MKIGNINFIGGITINNQEFSLNAFQTALTPDAYVYIDSILYGTTTDICTWTGGLLNIHHGLGKFCPTVKILVLNTDNGLYDICSAVPFEVIDEDYINLDLTGCSGLTFRININ